MAFSLCRLCVAGALVAPLLIGQVEHAAAADESCSFRSATVLKVETKSAYAADFAANPSVQLKDYVKFDVADLGTSLADIACIKKIVLFVNGQPIADALRVFETSKKLKPIEAPATAISGEAPKPKPPEGNEQASKLVFVLRPTKASADLWRLVLGSPSFGHKSIDVGVGLADGQRISSTADSNLSLVTLCTGWFAFWIGTFVLLLSTFLWLGVTKGMLRDRILTTDVPEKNAPFSLAKTQAAIWFFIVLAAYLLIGIVTGDFTTSINGTAVALLGIGGGTALGAVVIDASKRATHEVEKRDAEAENAAKLKTLPKEIEAKVNAAKAATRAVEASQQEDGKAAAEAAKDVAEAEKERLESQKREAVARASALKGASENFLLDILSDANGISFHRFQMAVWTAVLSTIFVVEVYETMSMPSFSTTLMGLLGLSAGTYLGLKIPEATVPNKTR